MQCVRLTKSQGPEQSAELGLVQAKAPSEGAAAHSVALKSYATEACEASLVMLSRPQIASDVLCQYSLARQNICS